VDSSAGPDWLREAGIAIRDEAVRFLVTVLQCSRHPGRFAAAWFAGETQAPNPIGYVSTALAVTAACTSMTGAMIGRSSDDGLWASLAAATLPYAYYALLGVVCHGVLRLGGTTRPLRASLAIALYIGGGPGLLLTLVLDLDVLLYTAITGDAQVRHGFAEAPPWAFTILLALVMAASALFVTALASGLRALHGRSGLRAAAAIVVAIAVSGWLVGALRAAFGFHLGVPYFAFHLGRPWFDLTY